MQIDVFSIQKTADDYPQIEQYSKMCSAWANVKNVNKFNSTIAKAQTLGKESAQKAYDEAYAPHSSGYCVGLDEKGVELDSMDFAKLLANQTKISFFIGGAYGHSENFKQKMNKLVSLSRLTLAHKIAKLMLFEQIYRGLSINANHPYHK